MDKVWEFHFDGAFTPCDIPEVNRAFKEGGDDIDASLDKHGFEMESVFTKTGMPSGFGSTEANLWINTSLDVWLIGLVNSAWVACRDLPAFLEFFRRYESFLRIGVMQELRELAYKVDFFLFDPYNGLDVVQRGEARRQKNKNRRSTGDEHETRFTN